MGDNIIAGQVYPGFGGDIFVTGVYTVPEGVCQLMVELAAGSGAAGSGGVSGAGGLIIDTVNVDQGDVIHVNLGNGATTAFGGSTAVFGMPMTPLRTGGNGAAFNLDSQMFSGGGGGRSVFINVTKSQELLIAGGGGGGAIDERMIALAGGDGGAPPGGNGANGAGPLRAGLGAIGSSGGMGGMTNGQDGADAMDGGAGGDGGIINFNNFAGGGGGGGWAGGGGGGSGIDSLAGGGGGGSSKAFSAFALYGANTQQDGYVIITPIACPCLAADTFVTMASGPAKLISEVRSGDLVRSHNGAPVAVLSNVRLPACSEFVRIAAGGRMGARRDLLIRPGHPVLLRHGVEIDCEQLIGEVPEAQRVRLDQPQPVYTLITASRTFVDCQGIAVATWDEHGWAARTAHSATLGQHQ